MYINSQTLQYPVSENEIKNLYPHTSWPAVFTTPSPFEVVFQAPPAAYDSETQYTVEIAPKLSSKGKWEQQWKIVDYTAEEIQARKKASVPSVVPMRQARLALLQENLLSQVDVIIAALPEPDKTKAKIEWEYSQEVQRHNGFVSVIGPALGLTEETTDDLFILAKTL